MNNKFYAFLALQLLLAAFALAVLLLLPGKWGFVRACGSALLLLGLLFLFTARLQLGRSFSITPQAKSLVTHGLYAKIRNPIYLFGTMAIVGTILILHRSSLWLLLAVVIPVQIIRAHREAKVLEAKFGDGYREYKSKTWF